MTEIQKQFIEGLCETFPDMANDILDEDYYGIFSLQIGVFRKYTQEAINQNNCEQVDKYLRYVNVYLKNVCQSEANNEKASEIENSLVLSYIGKLDFRNHPKSKCITDIQKTLQDYNDPIQKTITKKRKTKGKMNEW